MTIDRTWRGDRGHLAPHIIGGMGSSKGSAANVPDELPHLPVTCFEVNGASYEVHAVERRLEVVQRIIPEYRSFIGSVEACGGVYLATYSRSVQHLPPETNDFTLNDEGMALAIGWIVGKADAKLSEGYKRLVEAIRGVDDETNS